MGQNNSSLRVRDLNEAERRFAAAYVQTADARAALRASGLPEASGHTIRRLQYDPRIILAIQTEVAVRIKTEGAIIAQNVLIEIARDRDAAKGARVDAAKTLLDRAGHIAPRAEAQTKEGRALADYSIDELRSLVSQLERDRGDQARTVNAPVSPVASLELSDMLS